jgi:hypothetical protein
VTSPTRTTALAPRAAALKALSKAGVMGQYDQVVVFTADFGQADNANWDDAGPLFYRTVNAMAMKPVNEVGNIGLEVVPRDPAKPFVGVINGGNLKGAGNTPWTGSFGACGRNASVCASACSATLMRWPRPRGTSSART